jgi:hypothetical protein
MLVSWLACSSILAMEATFSSEMSVDFRRATLQYIPEVGTRRYRWFPSHFPVKLQKALRYVDQAACCKSKLCLPAVEVIY